MSNLNINTSNAVALNTQNVVQTMSSKEIATLTGKEHKNVKRDIEVMFTELELDTLNFEVTYLDNSGRQQKCYNLDKELTTCLVSGYNVKLKVKVLPLIEAKFNKEETMNTPIINTQPTISMTSLEIATLVDARHDSVKRSIERLVEQGVIPQPPMVDGIKSANGVVTQVYVFSGDQGKRDTTIIVAQLSPAFLGQLVDRWIELEKQVEQQFHIPTTYGEALLLASKLEEERAALAYTVIQQQQTIKLQTPKAEVYDIIANKDYSYTIRDTAKILKMRPIDLTTWLLENGWMYGSKASSYRPRAAHADVHIQLVVNTYGTQIRVMSQGLVLLAKRMDKELQNI